MVNTIGKSIPQNIIKQLKLRSEQNSRTSRDTKNLMYLANKTSFLRVVSSVNVPLDEMYTLQKNYSTFANISQQKDDLSTIFSKYFSLNVGDPSFLAKNYVLFAGTSKYDDINRRYGLRSGLGKDGAYGTLGDKEIQDFGYRPMPGITSVTVDTAGRMGSVRYCTVNFRVWDKMQLDIVDLLYFKLGYSMFVDWGHTYYYKSNEFNEKSFQNTDLGKMDLTLHSGEDHMIDPFSKSDTNAKWSKEELNLAILKESQRSEGNYDAMLGLCTNFNFSLNPEGGYDCSIKIIGLGYLADSLKINQPTSLSNVLKAEVKKIVDKKQAQLDAEAAEKDRIAMAQAKEIFEKQKDERQKQIDALREKSSRNLIRFLAEGLGALLNIPPDSKWFKQGQYAQTQFYSKLEPKELYEINSQTFSNSEYENLIRVLNQNPNFVRYPSNLESANYNVSIRKDTLTNLNYRINDNRILLGPLNVLYEKDQDYSFDVNLTFLKNKWLISLAPSLEEYKDSSGFIAGYSLTIEYSAFINGSKSDYFIVVYIDSTATKKNGNDNTAPEDDFLTKKQAQSIIEKNIFGNTYDESTSSDKILNVTNIRKPRDLPRTTTQISDFFGVSSVEFDNEVKNVLKKTGVDAGKPIDDTTLKYETKIYIETNDSSLFSKIKTKNPEYVFVNEEEIAAISQQLNQPFQFEATQAPKLNSDDIQDKETSRYQSGFELALRAIQLYSLNKTFENSNTGAISNVLPVKLLDKNTDNQSMASAIFTSDGAFKNIFDKLIDPTLDLSNEDLARKYIEKNGTPSKNNEITIDDDIRLAINALYGFSTEVMSAKKAEDLKNARRVDFKNLLHSYVVPYNITNSFLGTGEDVPLSNPVYVNFGFVLFLLNHFCLIYDSKTRKIGDKTNITPIFYIDFNTDSNLCLSEVNHISVDPLKFLVPCYSNQKQISNLFDKSLVDGDDKKGYFLKNNTNPENKEIVDQPVFNPSALDLLSETVNKTSPFKFLNGPYAGATAAYKGRIMNVLVNIDYVLKLFNNFSTRDGNQSVYLRSFLEELISDMNKAMGSFNVFRLAYNDQANTLLVIDDQFVPEFSEDTKPLEKNSNDSQIPLYGYKTVARNLEIKTEISTKLANMIAISANPSQEMQNSISQDATSFGFLNTKLEDRYITHRKDTSPSNKEETDEKKKKIIQEQKSTAIRFNYLMGRIFYGSEEMNATDASFCVNYYTEALAKIKSKTSGLQASVMVPVSLNFTTDGISGLSMYNSFTVSDEVLPYTYNKRRVANDNVENKVGFCIIGLTHRLENNQWTTDVRTNMIYVKDEKDYPTSSLSVSSAKGSFENTNVSNNYETVYSSVGGFVNEKNINGKIFKNGHLEDADLSSLSQDLVNKHKGSIESDNGRIRLIPEAMTSLTSLLYQSEKDGINLRINSAYRTYQDQVRVKQQYKELAATPGYSNHGFGLAIDFATNKNTKISSSDREYQWLEKNAQKYGFKRIPKEAWHWEYQIGALINQGIDDD